jgi:hypothetical protein
MKEYSLEYFAVKKQSFVLLKNEKIIYQSKSQGLKPLIFCLKKYKRRMRGGRVFDKVIGRAAALLLAHGKAKEVWTPVVSVPALAVLRKNKIKTVYQKKVKNIMNRDGSDFCPMEKRSRGKSSKEFCKILAINL